MKHDALVVETSMLDVRACQARGTPRPHQRLFRDWCPRDRPIAIKRHNPRQDQVAYAHSFQGRTIPQSFCLWAEPQVHREEWQTFLFLGCAAAVVGSLWHAARCRATDPQNS
jgi:hypothetical protein